MKPFVTLCAFLLLLPIEILQADETGKFSTLCHQASVRKDLKGYSAVCRYLYEKKQQPELLLTYADSIRQLAMRTNSIDCFIEYYAWNSEARFIKGDYAAGYALKRKALTLAERENKKFYIADCAVNIGHRFNMDARYDSARYYLKKGLVVAENMPELADKYRRLLTGYARSFLLEGQTDSALVYTLRAKKHSQEDKDTAILIENLNQLGTIYRRKKNMGDCMLNFEKALQLCEAQQNFRVAAVIYGNIATAYGDCDRSEEAVSFSEKAVEYALELGNSQVLGVCYVNLGATQVGVPELRMEGIANLQKAIPILLEAGSNRWLCEAYGYLANAYWQNGERVLAVEYLDKLDKLADALKTDVERYSYYQLKAPLLLENGQYAEAVTYYLQITDMLGKGYKDARDYEHYARLAECYHALNNDEEAYINLRKAYSLRDSTFRMHYLESMSDYSVKYETKEKELEIIRLKRSELERERELMFRRVIFASIFVMLVIVLLVLLYARQRQKMRLTKLSQAAGEKERQFLTLQKETEYRLTRKYIEGLESERERMATELHDDVCNDLLAFEMNISALAEEDGRDLKEQLKLLNATRERLRSISHELMPPTFQYATIDEMLADYILHLPLPEMTKAEYHSTGGMDWNLVPQEIGFELYRIVQEAVSNAMKYAEATCIRVELSLEGKYLSLLIADDGKGFDSGRKIKGIGLRTIEQRAKIIGGKMELDTAPGAGVRIKVSVWI